MKLTREERKGVYRGLRKLLRPSKPDLKGGETLILGWTRGGRYVVDYETGETAERVQRPTVWIKFKEPEETPEGWVIRFEFHDEREQRRMLGGVPSAHRETALRTRWRAPERVPTREEERERDPLTDETARGYVSGGNTKDHLEGVNDEWLATFALQAKEKRAEEHPEETQDEEIRRLANKARRLQKEAEKAGVDLRGDLTRFNERAREAIVAAKATKLPSE